MLVEGIQLQVGLVGIVDAIAIPDGVKRNLSGDLLVAMNVIVWTAGGGQVIHTGKHLVDELGVAIANGGAALLLLLGCVMTHVSSQWKERIIGAVTPINLRPYCTINTLMCQCFKIKFSPCSSKGDPEGIRNIILLQLVIKIKFLGISAIILLMISTTPRNIAYIDGQNLYMGTAHADKPWKIDCRRFRRFLYEKYHVTEAYYFIGTKEDHLSELYSALETAGFKLVFRPHSEDSHSGKKGNVDTDIVFMMMRDMHEGRLDKSKAVLVSGDGDYFRTVTYLITNGKLDKVLLPNWRKSSMLYKMIDILYIANLGDPYTMDKIKYIPRH